MNGSAMPTRILAACIPVLFAWQIASATDPANGTIAVSQTVQCCYREGSVSFVTVRQVGNDRPTTKVWRLLAGLEPVLLVETELAPGDYVVSSYQRPCDGNCDVLDSPIDTCQTEPLEVSAGTALNVLVSVVPFGGCSISVESESVSHGGHASR
jgi:hypothetical protein